MDEDSEDIHSQNLISYYQKLAKLLENYCLADFAAELRINVPKNNNFETQQEETDDDTQQPKANDENHDSDENTLYNLKIECQLRNVERLA